MPKCSECGYLCQRGQNSRELMEVELRQRINWSDSFAANPLVIHEFWPICFAMQPHIQNDMKEKLHGTKDHSPELNEILHADRECDKFVPWAQGFTPKEHLQMFLADQQRERDLSWQKKQKREDRFWEFAFLVIGGLAGYFFGKEQSESSARPEKPITDAAEKDGLLGK